MQPRRATFLSIVRSLILAGGFVALSGSPLRADVLTLSGGAFSLNAMSNNKSTTIAGPGAYSIGWYRPVFSSIDLVISYTLLMSNVIGGDLGYGPDIGFALYPFTRTEALESRSENASVRINEIWRPFVAGQFIQRQFQSVQSSYSGFQMSIGTFYYWSSDLSLSGQLRFGGLVGPGGSTASETSLIMGIALGL